MKKILAGVLISVLILSIGTATAFADKGDRELGSCFTDVNGDGICDYVKTVCRQAQKEDNRTDSNAKTVNRNSQGGGNSGSGYARSGQTYTDANGDGVCDNYTERICPQDGTGRHGGFRGGCGR